MEIREERRPLAPQFTLRWLLGLMTVCGLLFAVFGSAARGHAWAIGVSAGMGVLLLMPLVYALLFGCASVAAVLFPRRGDEGNSPFAAAGPLPAISASAGGSDGPDTPVDAEIVS